VVLEPLHVVSPYRQGVGANRTSYKVMAGSLDHKPHIVLLGELDGELHTLRGSRIHDE